MRLLPFTALSLLSIPAAGEDLAPMALNSYSAPPPGIMAATVFQQNGALLGNVQGLDRTPAAIEGIRIGVAGPRVITLGAAEASYDEAQNVLVADERAVKAALDKSTTP